jgi:hypothetical protein
MKFIIWIGFDFTAKIFSGGLQQGSVDHPQTLKHRPSATGKPQGTGAKNGLVVLGMRKAAVDLSLCWTRNPTSATFSNNLSPNTQEDLWE